MVSKETGGKGEGKNWRIRECCADSTLDKNQVDCKAAEHIGNLAAEIDLGCQHIADAQLEIAERVKDIAANDHEFKEVTLARERLKAD